MHSGFSSIADIIKNEPAFDNLRRIIKEGDIISDFHNMFPNLEKLVVPVKVEKRTLFLKVENSICRSELKFNERTIMDKINNYYNEKRIASIRFLSR